MKRDHNPHFNALKLDLQASNMNGLVNTDEQA